MLGRPSDEDSSGSTASQLSRQAQGVAMQQQKSVTHRAAVGVDGSEGGGQLGGTSSLPAVMSKANLRRAARKERDARWAALRASKPDDAFEAPEDVEALRVAAATIGDLKLRSAPDYIPDKVRAGGVALDVLDFQGGTCDQWHTVGCECSMRHSMLRV